MGQPRIKILQLLESEQELTIHQETRLFAFFFRVSCVSVGAESFPGPAHTLNASAFTTVCIGIGRALIVRIS